jgi:multiple sugar transport system permease protein
MIHPRPAESAPKTLRGGLKRTENAVGFLFVVPALITFALIIAYPLVSAVALSLYRYNLLTPQPIFIGTRNFEQFFGTPSLLQAWLTTLVFVVLTTALTFVLGLVWALLLNQPFPGNAVLRSVSLLPWIFPSTVVAFLWAWIFNGQYGVLNALLLSLGVIREPVVWLSTPNGAMAAVVLAKTWLSVPLFMAFFLAGLQSLPTEQAEAARVDGANNAQVLRHVVLPHLRTTMVVVVVLGAIGNLQQFDVIYALTGGGPVRATTVLSIEVFRQAFQNFDSGLAATIGVIWLLTIAVPAFF